MSRSHAEYCRQGFFGPDGWEWGVAPPGVDRWHTASCEPEPMQKAYALGAVRKPDRYYTDDETGKRVDQSQRYARAVVELIYG